MYKLWSFPYIGEVSEHRFVFQLRTAQFIECKFWGGRHTTKKPMQYFVAVLYFILWMIYIQLHKDRHNNAIYYFLTYLSLPYIHIMSCYPCELTCIILKQWAVCNQCAQNDQKLDFMNKLLFPGQFYIAIGVVYHKIILVQKAASETVICPTAYIQTGGYGHYTFHKFGISGTSANIIVMLSTNYWQRDLMWYFSRPITHIFSLKFIVTVEGTLWFNWNQYLMSR